MAAWWGSRRAGVVLALACGACWYVSDRLSGTPYSRTLYIYWETLMRLVSYLLVGLSLSQVRSTLRRQQDLLRIVSHDLRSPLTAITGQAQLLAARAEPGSWVAVRAESILRVSHRMATMIDDLVDAARHQSRRLQLDLQHVELAPFLNELLRRMSAALPCERVDLQVRGEGLAVQADPARLERIVVNLLSNALRYSPGPSRVQLQVEPAGGRVILAVVDHGPGIAEDDRPHLFEQYFRGHASAGSEGLGLGLHSAQLLVLAHGGRIRAEGTRGGGATFLVELPADQPPPPHTGEPGVQPRIARTGADPWAARFGGAGPPPLGLFVGRTDGAGPAFTRVTVDAAPAPCSPARANERAPPMCPPPPRHPRTAAGGDATPDRILGVRMDDQYRRLPVSQATVGVNAALLAVVLGWTVPLRIWLAATVAVAALRLAAWAVRRRRPAAAAPRRWNLLHVAGAAANGLLWGALPAAFFPQLGVAEHMFLSAVIVGMVAGSAASTLGHPPALAAFALPALAPLAFRLAGSASALERAAGILVCVFAVAMWVLARTAARNLTASLVHRFRNDALVEQLSAAGRELAAVNAGLEETVRQRTGELVELERRLAGSALLASVGSLAAAVAHDINNPLASLLSSVRLLEEEARSWPMPLSPSAREELEDVRACAERVRAIVRSLGDVARVDGRSGPLDLREILESCLEVAAPELRGRVRVVRDLATPCRVMGERGSLSQVFLGLILHLTREVPPGEPPAHELRVAVVPPGGQTAAVEIACQPPPVESSGGRDAFLSPFHAAVARVGGSIVDRADRSGFVVLLPVEARAAPDRAED